MKNAMVHKVLFWQGPLLTLIATGLVCFVLIMLGSPDSLGDALSLDPIFLLFFIPSALGIWEQVYLYLAIYKGRPAGKVLLTAHVLLSVSAGVIFSLLVGYMIITPSIPQSASRSTLPNYLIAVVVGLILMTPYASLPFYYRTRLKHGKA